MMIYIVNGRPVCVEDDVLMHYGVKGMKWGVRKKIQDVYNGVRKAQSRIKQMENSYNRLATKARNSKLATSAKNIVSSKKSSEPSENLTPEEARKQKVKRAVKIGAAVAGTALAVYAGKKFHDAVREKNFKICMDFGKKQADMMFDREMKKLDLFPNRNGLSRAANEAFIEDRYREIIRNAGNAAHESSFRDALRTVVKDKKNKRLLQRSKPILTIR